MESSPSKGVAADLSDATVKKPEYPCFSTGKVGTVGTKRGEGEYKSGLVKFAPIDDRYDPENAPAGPCWTCRQDDWWFSSQGSKWLCKVCHPPAPRCEIIHLRVNTDG